LRTGDSRALRTADGTSVTELLGRALLAGQALRPCTALLGKALLSGKTLLSRRATRPLLANLVGLTLATRPCATLASSGLSRSALSRSALLSGTTLLQWWIAAGALLAELFGLPLPTRSGAALLSGPALLATRALLAKLLRLAWLALTTLTWATLAWDALANTTRPSVTWSGATLATLLELFAALARSAELLRLSLLPTLLATLPTLLATLTTLLAALATLLLLSSRARSSWTAGSAWSFVGRLAALLGLSLWLTFVLLLALILVLGVFALRDDQTAICSAGAVKRDAQLRNRNRRHQGASQQDVAKLLQLPDRFEWQVALPRIVERRTTSMRSCRPDCGTSSAPLRPDFGNRLNGFQ
jgi:hypothetical protein